MACPTGGVGCFGSGLLMGILPVTFCGIMVLYSVKVNCEAKGELMSCQLYVRDDPSKW